MLIVFVVWCKDTTYIYKKKYQGNNLGKIQKYNLLKNNRLYKFEYKIKE